MKAVDAGMCVPGLRPLPKTPPFKKIMPTQESAAIQDQLKLITRIDSGRPAEDPSKLPAFLLADATADLATLVDTDEDTAPAEGERAAANQRRRRALDELERQLRGGYRFLVSIDEDDISDDERRRLSRRMVGKAAKLARC